MTNEEQLAQLMSVVNTLAATVMHHDDRLEDQDRRIAALLNATERNERHIAANSGAIADLIRTVKDAVQRSQDLEREWQAYLKRLPPQ